MQLMRKIALLGLLLCFAGAAVAAPDADLWQRWTRHESGSHSTIEHGAWTTFLQKYVVRDDKLDLNRVRYKAVSDADRKSLEAYIQRLEKITIDKYNRGQQRAYWINLYNAETVDLILQHYPVKSIRNIGGGLFSSGPWNEKLLSVEGQKLSLNDIEHRILRPIWHDTLTHYGVNCASVSCPNLRMQAYTGAHVKQQLRANARAYINSPRGVRFDGKRLIVSKIFKWYQQDFGRNQTAVVNYLRRFAEPKLSARLKAASTIDVYHYDWSLNDAK